MANDSRWRQAPLSGLADHIVSAHHAFLYRQLPLLSELLGDLTRRNWMKQPNLLKVHALFQRLRMEIEQHLMKEETAGFAALHAYEAAPGHQLDRFVKNIDAHVAEHASVTQLLQTIREAAQDYKLPGTADAELAFAFEQLRILEADMAEHIHLENDILFVRVRRAADN